MTPCGKSDCRESFKGRIFESVYDVMIVAYICVAEKMSCQEMYIFRRASSRY